MGKYVGVAWKSAQRITVSDNGYRWSFRLDEHDYTHERLTQFVKERMDRCFTSENVSLFAPKQPVVNRTNWNVQLIDHQDFRSSHIVAKKGLGLGYNLGRFLYTYRCYYSFFPTTWLYYVFIEQRVATTSVSTTISEPVCDSNLPEGRDKWCRRIPYFFTRFKC